MATYNFVMCVMFILSRTACYSYFWPGRQNSVLIAIITTIVLLESLLTVGYDAIASCNSASNNPVQLPSQHIHSVDTMGRDLLETSCPIIC